VLVGNHEILLLVACAPGPDQRQTLSVWRANGGRALVAQLGIFDLTDDACMKILESTLLDAIVTRAVGQMNSAPPMNASNRPPIA